MATETPPLTAADIGKPVLVVRESLFFRDHCQGRILAISEDGSQVKVGGWFWSDWYPAGFAHRIRTRAESTTVARPEGE